MFNYVNELNQEAEKLEEQAVELQRELQRSRSATHDEDSMRQQLLMVRCVPLHTHFVSH